MPTMTTKTTQDDAQNRRVAYLIAYIVTLLAAIFAYAIWSNRNVELWKLTTPPHYAIVYGNTFTRPLISEAR